MRAANPPQPVQEKSLYLSLIASVLLSAATSLAPSLVWAAAQPLSMATATLSPEEAGEPQDPFADLRTQPATLPTARLAPLALAPTTAKFPPEAKAAAAVVEANPKKLSMATATLTPEEAGEQPLLYTAENTAPPVEATKEFLAANATPPKDAPTTQPVAANSSSLQTAAENKTPVPPETSTIQASVPAMPHEASLPDAAKKPSAPVTETAVAASPAAETKSPLPQVVANNAPLPAITENKTLAAPAPDTSTAVQAKPPEVPSAAIETKPNTSLTENTATPPLSVDATAPDLKKTALAQPVATNSDAAPTEAGAQPLSAKLIAPTKKEALKKSKHTPAPPPPPDMPTLHAAMQAALQEKPPETSVSDAAPNLKAPLAEKVADAAPASTANNNTLPTEAGKQTAALSSSDTSTGQTSVQAKAPDASLSDSATKPSAPSTKNAPTATPQTVAANNPATPVAAETKPVSAETTAPDTKKTPVTANNDALPAEAEKQTLPAKRVAATKKLALKRSKKNPPSAEKADEQVLAEKPTAAATPLPPLDVSEHPTQTITPEAVSAALPAESSDAPASTNHDQTNAWAPQLQIMEQENQALRQKLGMNETDRLNDIKVDAVAQIHEEVLRARIAELEKQINKLNMKNDNGDLPEKTENPLSSTPKPPSKTAAPLN